MKDTLFMKPGKVAIETVDKPELIADDDVIIHIVRACVCGSDLWAYRGLDEVPEHSQNSGHEASELSNPWVLPLRPSSLATSLSRRSLMAVVTVRHVAPALKVVA